jgi:transposase-like protein
VVLRMLADVRQKTIRPIMEAAVAEGTRVHTDEYASYARLPAWGYRHVTVCHARGEYARDEDGDGLCEMHVNTMEGTWSLLRSWLRPHRGISQACGTAALPRLLRVRAQRPPPRQSPPRRPRRSPGGVACRHPPGSQEEPRAFEGT